MKWQPAPVFLPGKIFVQQSLVGYGPQGHKESDMTERPTHTVCPNEENELKYIKKIHLLCSKKFGFYQKCTHFTQLYHPLLANPESC